MSNAAPPPNDLDAEAAVLSAILLKPDTLAEVEPIVAPADFFSRANQLIAEAIWALDAASEKVDAVSVASWLQAREKLQQVGGTPYLAQVLEATPAVAHVEDHARIVAGLARIRRVQALCLEIRAEGYTARENVAEWLQSVEARVFEATHRREAETTISTLRDVVVEQHQALYEPEEQRAARAGRRTRIPSLDMKFEGLDPGNVYIIAARPGHGKTALAEQIALEVAKSGEPVHFASIEMPRDQLALRALSQQSGVSFGKLRARTIEGQDWQPLADAVQVLSGLNMTVDDAPGQSVHHVRSAARRSMRRLGVDHLGLLVIDYFQLMATHQRRNGNRDQELGDVSRAIKDMAKEFQCPILLLAQLNREIEKRPKKRPIMSDLRECGALEADAFGIIFVYREDAYRDEAERDGKAELIVGKNRGGPTGTVWCRYRAETMRFYEGEDGASAQREMYRDIDNRHDDYQDDGRYGP